MSFATVLRSYATLRDPAKQLPSSVHLLSNDHALAIFDKYPKAKYHFLVLPRWPFVPSTSEAERDLHSGEPSLSDIRPNKRPRHRRSSSSSSSSSADWGEASGSDHGSPARAPHALEGSSSLLSLGKMDSIEALICQAPDTARRQVLKALRKMGDDVADMIKDEMVKSEGFEWGVEMGFHIIPSISHLHLHVISSDLVSDRLTSKKHYNSFKPNESYFVRLQDVEAMLDEDQKSIDRRISNLIRNAKSVLAAPLTCHKCGESRPNMPALKEHLEQEWRAEGKRRKGGKGRAI